MFLFCKFFLSIILLWTIGHPNDTPFVTMQGDCRYPALSAGGTSVYMVWLAREKRPSHVYFQKSSDEGTSWSGSKKISNDGGDCMPPTIAVVSGTLHLAWVDCSEVIEGELYYTQSSDDAVTWEKNSVIVGNMNSATNPMISGEGKNVYLIWQDVATTVFFMASRDKGKTWEKQTLLGEVGKHSCYCFPPALSSKGDTLTVVWNDLASPKNKKKWCPFLSKPATSTLISSLVCKTSTDNGRSWSKERILSSKPVLKETIDEVDNPVLFTDGTRTWLFWQAKHTVPLGEILYTKIGSLPTKRTTGKSLYPSPKRALKCPSGVFDGNGNLHLSFTSKSRGTSLVHYGVIDSAGMPLREKSTLTTTDGRYQNPVMARTASGVLHIAWFNKSDDKHTPSKLFLATSSDNGLTWNTRVSERREP